MATHGIYPSLLADKSGNKYLSDITIDSSVFADNILIAHNAVFDTEVLTRS
jgi:DNA polymerase III alpha subunit (gram-positive type)